ncbi:unnamed protein product [Symbiodinium microadriaticum]|nr:unnamed protein product [Symbiodinium microadriaticum]
MPQWASLHTVMNSQFAHVEPLLERFELSQLVAFEKGLHRSITWQHNASGDRHRHRRVGLVQRGKALLRQWSPLLLPLRRVRHPQAALRQARRPSKGTGGQAGTAGSSHRTRLGPSVASTVPVAMDLDARWPPGPPPTKAMLQVAQVSLAQSGRGTDGADSGGAHDNEVHNRSTSRTLRSRATWPLLQSFKAENKSYQDEFTELVALSLLSRQLRYRAKCGFEAGKLTALRRMGLNVSEVLTWKFVFMAARCQKKKHDFKGMKKETLHAWLDCPPPTGLGSWMGCEYPEKTADENAEPAGPSLTPKRPLGSAPQMPWDVFGCEAKFTDYLARGTPAQNAATNLEISFAGIPARVPVPVPVAVALSVALWLCGSVAVGPGCGALWSRGCVALGSVGVGAHQAAVKLLEDTHIPMARPPSATQVQDAGLNWVGELSIGGILQLLVVASSFTLKVFEFQSFGSQGEQRTCF